MAGTLLKEVRSVTKVELTSLSDLGEGLYCSHSEPYYYESVYKCHGEDFTRPDTMTIDERGQCESQLLAMHRQVQALDRDKAGHCLKLVQPAHERSAQAPGLV